MAFRSGSVSGNGIVYSRRRGRGKFGNGRMLHNTPSVIYEESEDESDESVKSPLELKRVETSKATWNVLKDKSNVTRSPKRQSVRQIERQTWTTTNEPPRDRHNSRARGISSTLEVSQKPPQGWKTTNPSKSRIVSTPNTIQEDFEFGKTLASEADFEIYTDNQPEPLASAVKESSDNAVTSVSAKSQKGKSKSTVRKAYIARQPTTDTSTAKSQPASSSKSINNTSMLKTTSFTHDAVSPVEKNVIEDNALMDGFLDIANDKILFQHPETNQSIEKERPQKRRTEKRRAKAGKQTRGRRRAAQIKAIEEERTIADDPKDIENMEDFDKHEMLNHLDGTITNGTEMGDQVIGSSPPYSPPNIPLEQCFQTVLESMTPIQTSRESFNLDYVTPSRAEIPTVPPAVRKPFTFWNSPSRAIGQPFYIASPSPATDMRAEDFVMLRRTRGIIMEDEETDILEHRLESTHEIKDDKRGSDKKYVKKKTSVTDKKSSKNKGKKWVRFLDVGISCPSDESDDELAFCKPSWTKKKNGEQQCE